MLDLLWTFLEKWPLLLVCLCNGVLAYKWIHSLAHERAHPCLWQSLSLLAFVWLLQKLDFLWSLLFAEIECPRFLGKVKKVAGLLLYIFVYSSVELLKPPGFLRLFLALSRLEVSRCSSCIIRF